MLECRKILSRALFFPLLLPHIRTIRLVQIQRQPDTDSPAPALPTASLVCTARTRAPGRLRNGAPEPVSDPQDAAVHVFAYGK